MPQRQMRNKPQYIAALERAIKCLYSCGPDYLRTEHIREEFHGATVWEGDVEVFHLTDHPRAVQAYALLHPEKANLYVVVLGEPPITNARKAVQAAINAWLPRDTD